MEMEFSPHDTIDRLCRHHHTDATRLLAALLKALGRWRLRGWDAFPHVKPLPLPDGNLPAPDIHAEIQTLMHEQEPRLDPSKCSVGSILDAVIMCVNYDQWLHEQRADELMDDEAPDTAEGNHDYICGMMASQHAHDEAVLMLVIKECCNQLEAMKLELALERESGS